MALRYSHSQKSENLGCQYAEKGWLMILSTQKYGATLVPHNGRYGSGPRRSTKYPVDIYRGGQLVQETATLKFVDYPDYLVRVEALATV
ncbi:hypothetical protein TNCV_933261 [Trichonephila clavipes]|nr:hypothetical protein TNCV_933261 [Trichonephila clavipes]